AMAAFWRGATSRRAIFLGARHARRPQHCASAGGNGSSGVVRSVGRTFARLGRHRHAQAIRPPPELDLRREPVRDLRRDRISRAGRQHRRREVGSPASGPQAAHPGCAWITAFTGQSSARAVEMFSGLNWLARVQRLEPVNATLTGQSTCLFNGFANNFGEVTIDRLTLRTRKLPGGPACHRNSYRYLPISLLSGLASPPSGLGHSTVWRLLAQVDCFRLADQRDRTGNTP